MSYHIENKIVDKSEIEFANFSDSRIEGLKLTLDDKQIKLYRQAKEKGLELLSKARGEQ
jgi:hypothetical protein